MCDCNPKITMKDNLSDKVCIPMEYKDAYEKFPYLKLCKCSMSLFHAAARNHGGQYFNLKSVLGDVMLLDEDCDGIFCILSDVTSRNNLSMRKQTLTEASLEENLMNENKKIVAMLLQNDVKDLLLAQIIKETIQWKTRKMMTL